MLNSKKIKTAKQGHSSLWFHEGVLYVSKVNALVDIKLILVHSRISSTVHPGAFNIVQNLVHRLM